MQTTGSIKDELQEVIKRLADDLKQQVDKFLKYFFFVVTLLLQLLRCQLLRVTYNTERLL